LLISPAADLSDLVPPLQDAGMQVHNSSGNRNHAALHGEMGDSLICLRSPDPTSLNPNTTKIKEKYHLSSLAGNL
jgi:hypothetical protein